MNMSIENIDPRVQAGIDTSGPPWWQLAEQATAKVSCSKTFFLVNSVYTNNVLNAHVNV